MSAHARATGAAIVTAALLWLGLSPRVANFVYVFGLMPRCKCENPDKPPAQSLIRPVSFGSGGVYTLYGHIYTNANSRKLFIFFGGRRSNQDKNLIRAEALLQTGASVFIFDYRGFGNAKGRATLNSLLEDGLAAYDTAIELGYTPEQIVLYGESLGSAVAAYVSSKRSCSGLILQSAFCSLEAQIKDMIPVLRIYPRCMFPGLRFSTADCLRDGHPPLLILHGDSDTVVGMKHSRLLAKAAGANTKLVILPGATHQYVYEHEDWSKTVSEFVSSLATDTTRQEQQSCGS